MSGISDLFGRNGAIEQLLLWNLAGQVIGTTLQPGLSLLAQDVNAAHPVLPVDPATAADLAARGIITVDAGVAEARLSGLAPARWHHLLDMHTVRLAPSDLATAVLRSYMTEGEATAQARPQGVTPEMLTILTQLAGDALGPDQLVQAWRRGIVPLAGQGPESVSFEQGIAESRLHNKWGPVLRALSEQLLTPADLASAVVRNFVPAATARTLAQHQGVTAETLDVLIRLSGDAPGPQQLAEALRRGAIPETGTGPESTSFRQGIAEGRLADKWAPVIQDLAKIWPTPVDALDASVKGVFGAAEGKALYERLGGDPQFYDWLLYSIGGSPTPLEAAVLAARRIIPWEGTGPTVTSYEQAVKESRYRDKWSEAYRRLAEHIPPPSTIASMLSHRVLSKADAESLLLQNDMSEALADAYVGEAEYEAISDYRGLTQSAVIEMYVAHIISQDQAVQLLSALHVSEQAARLLLDYADMRYAIEAVNRAISRIGTLFTGRKISAETAAGALHRLDVPADSVADIISDWETEAAANVKTLTESQITDAFYYKAISLEQATESLQAIGYTPFDSWVLLSLRVKAPLPGKPPRDVAPPPGAVLPGVT